MILFLDRLPPTLPILLLPILAITLLIFSRKRKSFADPHSPHLSHTDGKLLPLPPTPPSIGRPLPLGIGHILSIPVKHPWRTFASWSSEPDLLADREPNASASDSVVTSKLGQRPSTEGEEERDPNVFSYTILGTTFIVLNSKRAIDALFSQQSAIFSDRPKLVMLKDWAGWTWALPGLDNTPTMYLHRRLLAGSLSPSATRNYHHQNLERSALEMVKRVVAGLKGQEMGDRERGKLRETESSEGKKAADGGFWEWCHLMVTTNILKMTYDYTPLERFDPWIERCERILALILDFGILGTHPIDIFPALSRLPPRLFGSKFAENLAEVRLLLKRVYEEPYVIVRDALYCGEDKPCHVSRSLEALSEYTQNGKFTIQEVTDAIKGTAAAAYTGGVETVESTISTFILNMVLHPEIQSWARELLDEYLRAHPATSLSTATASNAQLASESAANTHSGDPGDLRLPSLADRHQPGIEVIEALLWETLRIEPSVPLAVARRAASDGIYAGMRIPKGAVVIGHSWYCLHESSRYSSPHTFSPSRFMPSPASASPSYEDKSDQKTRVCQPEADPRDFAFGYGRRTCPGRHFAEASIWITIATLLTLFELERDSTSSDDCGFGEYESGMVAQFPKPFSIKVKLREGAEKRLNRAIPE